MAEEYVAPRSTKTSFKIETTEGTAPTDTAADSLLVNIAPSIKGLTRNWFDRNVMLGHLGHLRPLDAGPSEPGCAIQVEAKGSGTHGDAPEIGQMLECSMGVKTIGVAGIVSAATTASTSAFTVLGASLTDEDNILVEIGTHWEAEHVDSLTAGTGVQAIGLLGTTSLAPVHDAEVVDNIEDGTVAASPSPSTTAFDVTGGSMTAGQELLVEVTGATGYFYRTTVTTATPGAGVISVVVSPALPAAPTSGDSVVIYVAVTTVLVCAAPSTTGCAVVGATVAAGQLADIEIGTATYETRQIKMVSAGIVTWFPPVSAAPATAANFYPGVSYLLSSTYSDYKSGSAFFYFPNGEKLVLSGLRGNPVFTLGIREPMLIDFEFTGIKAPATSKADVGYTWAPPDFAVIPEVCLAVEMRAYIPALIKTGSSTTSVLLKNLDGSASAFEATNTVDKLIVDVGSGVYETKTITTWNYDTQTAIVPTLGGAPAADANAYIQRTICVPKTLTIDPGHVFTLIECMSATDGWVSQHITDRKPKITWDEYFKSFIGYRLLQQAAFVEFWAVLGDTRGNKIALCIPNVFRQEYELDLGGEFGMVKMTAGAYANDATGNNEIYLTFL